MTMRARASIVFAKAGMVFLLALMVCVILMLTLTAPPVPAFILAAWASLIAVKGGATVAVGFYMLVMVIGIFLLRLPANDKLWGLKNADVVLETQQNLNLDNIDTSRMSNVNRQHQKYQKFVTLVLTKGYIPGQEIMQHAGSEHEYANIANTLKLIELASPACRVALAGRLNNQSNDFTGSTVNIFTLGGNPLFQTAFFCPFRDPNDMEQLINSAFQENREAVRQALRAEEKSMPHNNERFNFAGLHAKEPTQWCLEYANEDTEQKEEDSFAADKNIWLALCNGKWNDYVKTKAGASEKANKWVACLQGSTSITKDGDKFVSQCGTEKSRDYREQKAIAIAKQNEVKKLNGGIKSTHRNIHECQRSILSHFNELVPQDIKSLQKMHESLLSYSNELVPQEIKSLQKKHEDLPPALQASRKATEALLTQQEQDIASYTDAQTTLKHIENTVLNIQEKSKAVLQAKESLTTSVAELNLSEDQKEHFGNIEGIDSYQTKRHATQAMQALQKTSKQLEQAKDGTQAGDNANASADGAVSGSVSGLKLAEELEVACQDVLTKITEMNDELSTNKERIQHELRQHQRVLDKTAAQIKKIQAQQRATMLETMGTLQTACQARVERDDAAITVQKHYRGYRGRLFATKKKEEIKETTVVLDGLKKKLKPAAKAFKKAYLEALWNNTKPPKPPHRHQLFFVCLLEASNGHIEAIRAKKDWHSRATKEYLKKTISFAENTLSEMKQAGHTVLPQQ